MRRKTFANLGHYDGQVALISITAPGSESLPWDCSGDHDGPCSGKKGCRVDRAAASAWNVNAVDMWPKLHRSTAQAVRRQLPHLQILGRVWEFQRRGVLHVHVVVGLGTPAAREAARRYQLRLADRAQAYGFGYVDRKMSSARGENAAAYVSSYFVDGKGRKASVRETVKHPDVPPHVLHISTLLTTATGVTMRSLRRVRYMHVLARELEAGRLVVDVETGELIHRRRSVVLQT